MIDTTGNTTKLTSWITALRPNQWTKNMVVAAAFFFAYWDRAKAGYVSTEILLRVLPATGIFCIISSGIYLLNDVRDAEADRLHPVKKHRPIAAGKISPQAGMIASALLLCVGLLASALFSPLYALTTSSYVLLQLLYTFILKKIALVDVFVISFGFVLRAVAGVVSLNHASISPWLLLCTFLLALFLGLCKRRHEKLNVTHADNQQRRSLDSYDTRVLDQLIAMTGAATLVSYSIYTFWPRTMEKFGTSWLPATIPFVMFGIYRYLDLVYRHSKGDRPEKILLTDKPLIINLLLYAFTVLLIMQMTGG